MELPFGNSYSQGQPGPDHRQHLRTQAPFLRTLTVLRLGELVLEAGLPAGVLNIVSGPGESVGEALVKHPKIAKINFTGDSETGKRIMRLAGDYVRPVAAELGGKNAFIVLQTLIWTRRSRGQCGSLL